MKKILFMLVASVGLLFLHTVVYGQSGNDPGQVIEQVVETGGMEGHDAKVIGGMGDAAAVIVTKVLAGRNLRPHDVDSVLWIFGHAFASPCSFQNTPDREPKTAFLLLRYFELSTTDPQLSQRIAEMRKYIQRNCPGSHQAGGVP